MRREPSGGFTLIEMMAVVAIFALLSALLLPQVGAITGRTLRQAADELAAQLELARQRSVVIGVPHRVMIDVEGAGYRLEWRVTEARALGEEPEEELPLDVRGQAPLPLEAPLEDERSFHPVPGTLGRMTWLDESLFFEGLETPEGWIERGEAGVEFETDGTATQTAIHLADEAGHGLVLDVRPLADAVRIEDAS